MWKNDYKGRRILVTGGTGFLGGHLVKALIDSEAEVHVLSRKSAADIRVGSGLNHEQIDVADEESLYGAMERIMPDMIFHLAADINRERGVDHFQGLVNTNILGLLNLLRSMVRLDCKAHTVISGTADEYGINSVPFKEDMREKPCSPYAFTKVAATHLAQTFCRLYSLPLVVLRPTIAYGPKQKDNMFIPSMIKALRLNEEFKMTEGEQTRDFVFIEDLIEAYMKTGLLADKLAGEVINIGSGKPYKIKEVAKMIEKMMGKDNLVRYGALPARHQEISDYYSDIRKAKKLLNWEPRTGLEDGLHKTIQQEE
jgi:UDP-glucose 4-epimerase